MPDFLALVLSTDMGLPLLASLITGMLIGIDCEVQGKPAGLRPMRWSISPQRC